LEAASPPPAAPRTRRRTSLFEAYRKLLPYLRRYRGAALMTVVLGAVAGAGSKLVMVLLQPLLARIFPAKEAEGAASPLRDFSDQRFEPWLAGLPDLGFARPVADVVWIVAMIAALAAVFAAAEYVFVRASRMLGVRLATDLRQDMAAHIVRLDVGWHGGRQLGDLVSRMTADVGASLRLITLIVEELVQCPFEIAAALVIAFAAEPTATVCMLVFLPLIAWPVLKFGPKVRRRSRDSQDRFGDTTQGLVQMLSGIRVVKAFRMEQREAEEFRRGNQRFVDETRRMVRAQAGSLAVTALLANGGIGVALGALALVHLLVTPIFAESTTMVVFFLAIGNVFAYAKRLTRATSAIYSSLGSVDRVFEVFDLRSGLDLSRSTEPWPGLRESIRFEDVRFAYPDAEDEALRGVDFAVRRGERIALVGLSGAGKSTLLDLVARFHDPSSGRILADGRDLRALRPGDWLERLAVVQQRPFLFQATIRENVRYGRPDASDDEVRRACEAARLGDLLARLPQGLDTPVGEGGARLSGGEAQRVTIARALLKDAEILLLDEATSALDSQSERLVQQALERLMEGRTTFVIAHRLATIRGADRILVLEDGRLVEEGTHDALLARGGKYAQLWQLQAGDPASSTTA
jgi:ABC-type multidrug transport system fused ATPase/permease subunit